MTKLKSVLENWDLSVVLLNRTYSIGMLMSMSVENLEGLGPQIANLNAKKELNPFASSKETKVEKFVKLAKLIYDTKKEIRLEKIREDSRQAQITELKRLLKEKEISTATTEDIKKKLEELLNN